MLIDRYAPEDVFAPVPELVRQTDPEFKSLDALLDDEQLFRQVKSDLALRFSHTADRGGHSTPVEAIVRLLLVKHLHNWSFQGTEERVVGLAVHAPVTSGAQVTGRRDLCGDDHSSSHC